MAGGRFYTAAGAVFAGAMRITSSTGFDSDLAVPTAPVRGGVADDVDNAVDVPIGTDEG